MLWFKRKQEVNSTYEERISTLEVVVSKLKRDVLSNSMDIDTMRDKVLRKIQKKHEQQQEEDLPLPPDDGFSEIRKIPNKGP